MRFWQRGISYKNSEVGKNATKFDKALIYQFFIYGIVSSCFLFIILILNLSTFFSNLYNLQRFIIRHFDKIPISERVFPNFVIFQNLRNIKKLRILNHKFIRFEVFSQLLTMLKLKNLGGLVNPQLIGTTQFWRERIVKCKEESSLVL